jgi:hypothetical protein
MKLSACMCCAAGLAAASPARAIVIGMRSNFQDGTTQGWVGASPVNIGTGGPGGAGDAYMRLTSTGGVGPGSRLATFNPSSDWTGDFLAAGVTSLEADMINLGTVPLEMRVVLFAGTGNRYTSTVAQVVPADGVWHHVAFGLGASDLTNVLGVLTYHDIITSVDNLMFRHDSGTPSEGGTAIATSAGIDNILAVPGPGAAAMLGLAAAGLGRRRR